MSAPVGGPRPSKPVQQTQPTQAPAVAPQAPPVATPAAPPQPAPAAEGPRPSTRQVEEARAHARHDVGAQVRQVGTDLPRATQEAAHTHSHGDAHRTAGTGPHYQTQTFSQPFQSLEEWMPDGRIPTDARQRANFRGQLETQLNAVYPDGFTLPSSVQRGSDDEMRLMHAMAQPHAIPPGGELDILVPRRGQDPQRVTIQRPLTGPVTGSLEGTGVPAVPPASTFATREAAVTAMQRDFGVRVRGAADNPGAQDWSLEQLQRAHQAFSTMSPDERTRLHGMDLVRREGPGPETRGFHGTANLAAFYNPNTAAAAGHRTNPAAIYVYDRAFQGDASRFVGGAANAVPPSVATIAHEAGHAVEGQPRNEAIVRRNAASVASEDARGPAERSITQFNRAQRPYGAAERTWQRATLPRGSTPAQQAEFTTFRGPFNTASQEVNAANRALAAARTPADIATARTRLDTAVTARDAALGTLPAGHPGRAAAERFQTAQNAYVATGRTAGERNLAFAERHAEYDSAVAEQSRVSHEDPRTHAEESASLHNFRTMMQRTHSEAVTAYGATRPEESYAEAFSLFRTDPQWLQANRPAVYQWFADGNHLDPR